MENVMYGVLLSSGEYEDYRESILFATSKRETAQKYIDKYNRLQTKINDWLEDIKQEVNDSVYSEDLVCVQLFDKYWTVDYAHPAKLITIEIR